MLITDPSLTVFSTGMADSSVQTNTMATMMSLRIIMVFALVFSRLVKTESSVRTVTRATKMCKCIIMVFALVSSRLVHAM